MADQEDLEKRWKETTEALEKLADLHVWPADKDVYEFEGELLEELDVIEYETGMEMFRKDHDG